MRAELQVRSTQAQAQGGGGAAHLLLSSWLASVTTHNSRCKGRAPPYLAQRVHVLLQLLVAGGSQGRHLERQASCTIARQHTHSHRSGHGCRCGGGTSNSCCKHSIEAWACAQQLQAYCYRQACADTQRRRPACSTAAKCRSHARCRSQPSRSARPDSCPSSASTLRARMAGKRENLQGESATQQDHCVGGCAAWLLSSFGGADPQVAGNSPSPDLMLDSSRPCKQCI